LGNGKRDQALDRVSRAMAGRSKRSVRGARPSNDKNLLLKFGDGSHILRKQQIDTN
jgi:hypothetical protein